MDFKQTFPPVQERIQVFFRSGKWSYCPSRSPPLLQFKSIEFCMHTFEMLARRSQQMSVLLLDFQHKIFKETLLVVIPGT